MKIDSTLLSPNDYSLDAAKMRLRQVINSGAGSSHHLQVALRLLDSDGGQEFIDKCDRCQTEDVLCWVKEDANGQFCKGGT